MKLHVFSVYDKAIAAFLPPFYARARGEAIRSFTEAALDPQRFQKHASDYVLMWCGEFDDNSGIFTCPPTGPERILSANETVSQE